MLTSDEIDYVRSQLNARHGASGAIRSILTSALPQRLWSQVPDGGAVDPLYTAAINACILDGFYEKPPIMARFLERLVPGDAKIEQMIQKITAASAVDPAIPDLFGSKLLFKRLPFLGRAAVRDHFKALMEDVPEQPIVVINGPSDSGKTYTAEFVRHIRSRYPQIISCHIRLQKGQGETIGAGELARDIATQLGGDLGLLPKKGDTNAIRWPQELANTLVTFAAATHKKCWIILDGFNDKELASSPDTRQLIVTLSHVITNGAAQTLHRLILLDFSAGHLLNPVGTIAIENIPGLPISKVEEFVREFAAARPPEEVQALIEKVKSGLPDPVLNLSEVGRRLADLVQLVG
ncbi:hypothetical protein ACNJX9_33090 [Bradyrhizobium sp. DASA03076]|uniref:hypothetical protein n=1 Tax=Bradyrhizobium sp. BLXBL-03 TaxID=3395916 RepID=UPI003F6FF425